MGSVLSPISVHRTAGTGRTLAAVNVGYPAAQLSGQLSGSEIEGLAVSGRPQPDIQRPELRCLKRSLPARSTMKKALASAEFSLRPAMPYRLLRRMLAGTFRRGSSGMGQQ